MPVESPQISIDPYKSQVPLVQIPQQDLQAAPTPGAIYSKGGGIATMADGVMKGMLKGLQMKEEKKYKTAEATMNAQDAGITAAKKNYDNLLVTKGDSPDTKAAYDAWVTSVNQAATQRQAFAVPEKTAKPAKGQKKDKTAPSGAPAAGGFGGALKQFFERNPHIIPEIAIMGMKSQITPYGQTTPEQQKQKTEMDAAQRQESIQKVTDAATLTRDKYAGKGEAELEKMPASNKAFKNALEEYKNAVEVLTPIGSTGKFQTLVDPQGQQHSVPMGTQIPEGWKLYEKATAGSIPKVGTEQEFTSQALKGYGYDRDTAPPNLLKYLHYTWQYKAAQTTSTSSEHLDTDPTTGQRVAVKTLGSITRGAAEPKPPAGFSPIGEDGLPQKKESSPKTDEAPKPGGRMTKPPSAQAASPSTGKGAMTPPPSRSGIRDTGMKSMQGAQNTQRTQTQEKASYEKANTAYQAALKNNKAKAPDAASLEKANFEALGAFNAAKAQIVLWKAKQIAAEGRAPWKAQAKGQDGNTYATMDGTNWVNIKTGYPYEEK